MVSGTWSSKRIRRLCYERVCLPRHLKTADFRDLAPLPDRLIICNPPYGIRLKKGDDMAAFMRDFGDFLKQKCTGSDAFIYVGDPELVKEIGLKAAWKKPLRNGGLDGRLVKYELY